MPTDFTSLRPDIAACGLYCGACREIPSGEVPGCRDNAKANWCKIRQGCTAHHYSSCADCTLIPLEACKKFNNPIAKIFALVFRSDRPACIRRIREIGYDRYASEMNLSGAKPSVNSGPFRHPFHRQEGKSNF